MKEALSALIDGEIHEVQAHLARLKTDADLRRAWDTYHLIGDALRGDVSRNLCVRVAVRLSSEPTVLAPQKRESAFQRAAWYSLSAAAGVAAVALVFWMAYPRWNAEPLVASGPTSVIEAATPPVKDAVRAVAAGPTGDKGPSPAATEVQDFQDYLFAHQSYSHASALQGVAPYARTVSEEREAGGR